MSLRLTPASRFTVYSLLGLGTALFGFPLLWLLLTSLKPIEQTMTIPPTFLPLEHTAEIDGRRVEVTLGFQLKADALLVEPVTAAPGSGRLLVSRTAFDEAPGAYRLVREARAGQWWVAERSLTKQVERPLAADVLPREAIRSEVRFRWENYGIALATIGGRNIEEIQGTVGRIGTGEDADVTFWRFVSNTLLVALLGVVGTVLSNAVVAYGFARLKWRGRETFFALTLATMMVPFPVLMVPLYGIFKELGWLGTLLPLWVPAWFGSAFNIFLMRQFFRTIPEELAESARIDGCSEWGIFWRIVLPLSKPVLAVAALFHFLWAWNDFLGPLLYLTRRHTFTLALALQNYQSQHGGVQWHYLMAASACTILPVILLFFFAQKTFIQGIATSGMKN